MKTRERQELVTNRMHRRIIMLGTVFTAVLITGCGGAGSGLTVPTVAPARVYTLGGFEPSGPVTPGRPVTVTFTVVLPSGKPLTRYKTGPGPHTGVHLIIVRDDLAYIIHQHPPIGPNGLLRQTVTFPAPGRTRCSSTCIRTSPAVRPTSSCSERSTSPVTTGRCRYLRTSPIWSSTATTSSWRRIHRCTRSRREFLNVEVTDSHGHKPTFVPWFGALAHAIFFRKGTLDYFHTHICAPNAPNCGVLPGRGLVADLGQLDRARKAHDRGTVTRTGHVATVPADETRRADRHRAVHAHGGVVKSARVRLRLFAAVVALGAGVAAVIVAILLVRSALARDESAGGPGELTDATGDHVDPRARGRRRDRGARLGAGRR